MFLSAVSSGYGVSTVAEKTLYAFEDVSDDLPRAPLAGMRALLSAGVVISTKGWAALNRDARWAIVQEGLLPKINATVVQALLRQASVSELRLVPQMRDPNATETPPEVLKAITPARRITNTEWASLRPIDRYVLFALTLNTRLFFRAVQEILPSVETEGSETWKAVVAHCEVTMRGSTLERLKSPTFLDGRAFVLARVAGVRAARRASETFDLRSEATIGPIELDWAQGNEPGTVLWQAHVSSWDGSFFAAASFAAATTAAVALCDMIAESDSTAALVNARIAEEPWQVGGDAVRDDATAVFTGKQRREAAAKTPAPPPVISAPPTPRVPEAPISTPAIALQQPVMPPPHHAHRPPPAVVEVTRPAALASIGLSNATLVGVVLGLLVLLLVFVILILVVLWGRAG